MDAWGHIRIEETLNLCTLLLRFWTPAIPLISPLVIKTGAKFNALREEAILHSQHTA